MTQKLPGLGRRVALFRKREGLSAQELGEDAGMSRSVIANIENGRRDDITVSELLAIARALRVPPVVILFDVTRPMAASGVLDGDEEQYIRPRVIDVVDWVAGLDGPQQWSDARARMEAELAENGPAVMPMTGVIVEAAYGESGWDAIRLLAVGRQLRTATEHHAELVRDFAFDVRAGRFGWEPDRGEHLALMDGVSDLVDSGSAGSLDVFLAKVSAEGPEHSEEAGRQVRRLKHSAQEMRELRGILKALGGELDPRGEGESLPAFGYENVLTLWERTRFRFMRDLVEGDLDPAKYKTADQIHRSIRAGKVKPRAGRGEAFGEKVDEAASD